MYYVYIIYSVAQDLYYKGYTENLFRRLLEHNEGQSRYTSTKGALGGSISENVWAKVRSVD